MHPEDNFPKQRKIVDYIIVIPSFETFEEYQDKIRTMIKEGWQPLGGISTHGKPDESIIFLQAMVKYED